MKNLAKRLLLAVCIVLLATQPTSAQVLDLDYNENDINHFRKVPLGGGCSTGGITELLGHKLPAERGGTGREQDINGNPNAIIDGETVNEVGRVKNKWGKPVNDGGWVAFSGNVQNASDEPLEPGGSSLRQLYMDYYITMRWNYASWNWDGTNGPPGPEDKEFYAGEPRVLVTNPRTQKSIIAVVLEAGPAPWTGVDFEENNTPKQGWVNPTVGTPATYNGRVSGFTDKGLIALGALQRMQDGGGDELIYSWAPDQNARPGPVDQNTSGTASQGASLCSGGTVVIDGLTYAFPLAPQTKIDYSNLPCGYPLGCHGGATTETPTGSAAFDLMYGPHGSVDNKDVYAITDGKITRINQCYRLPEASQQGLPCVPECKSITFVSSPAYNVNGQTIEYWYGHIANLTVEVGQEVKAGDKIAEVAPLSYGWTCRGGRDHLHIDRAYPGQSAGWCCRDPAFVKFMDDFWLMLPEGDGY